MRFVILAAALAAGAPAGEARERIPASLTAAPSGLSGRALRAWCQNEVKSRPRGIRPARRPGEDDGAPIRRAVDACVRGGGRS